ncbi:hypothetical protein DWB68_06270 [Galactobacter valiniphilus]|uniref:Uncharacterized protein n=1 Tax=Galactobacter valiniphilus TaxID=2676122 RepID=A0A399JEL2_9MICC|nr:hypothetical protein [Galactobacter valiniphilus]RII42552.1 hypothetical protein DWB68_06270 [Galactobacter valiniphilus]
MDPTEILSRGRDGTISRAEMIRQLSASMFTRTLSRPWPHDGSIPGTWDVVAAAELTGELSAAEVDTIRASARWAESD